MAVIIEIEFGVLFVERKPFLLSVHKRPDKSLFYLDESFFLHFSSRTQCSPMFSGRSKLRVEKRWQVSSANPFWDAHFNAFHIISFSDLLKALGNTHTHTHIVKGKRSKPISIREKTNKSISNSHLRLRQSAKCYVYRMELQRIEEYSNISFGSISNIIQRQSNRSVSLLWWFNIFIG